MKPEDILTAKLVRKSVDARDKGDVHFTLTLDVDGDCGGFNLQWAWSSALLAAEGIEAALER